MSNHFPGQQCISFSRNVSWQDVQTKLIAEQTTRDVSLENIAHQEIIFAINVEFVDTHANYFVRVHGDVNNDGQISKGDFVTAKLSSSYIWLS